MDFVGGGFRLALGTTADKTYVVECKSSLAARSWTGLETVTGDGQEREVVDAAPLPLDALLASMHDRALKRHESSQGNTHQTGSSWATGTSGAVHYFANPGMIVLRLTPSLIDWARLRARVHALPISTSECKLRSGRLRAYWTNSNSGARAITPR